MNFYEQAQQAFKDGNTINITPNYHVFDKENSIVCGRYISRSSVQSSVSNGTYMQYLFDTDDGLIKFHLGSATDSEAGEVMIKGHVYHIEYLGKEDLKGGKTVNKYHIEEIPCNV